MQGEGFRMEIEIEDESKPIWFYCSVKDHCQKGMFGASLPFRSPLSLPLKLLRSLPFFLPPPPLPPSSISSPSPDCN